MQSCDVSLIVSEEEDAKMSIKDSEEPLWWWNDGRGVLWILSSNFSQKLFQVICLLFEDFSEQFESAPMRT